MNKCKRACVIKKQCRAVSTGNGMTCFKGPVLERAQSGQTKNDTRLKAAEAALDALMADDWFADNVPLKLAKKIDVWYLIRKGK